MKKSDNIIILLICCIAFSVAFMVLRITDDDELDISYHSMTPTDEKYINNELGIIDVPVGGIKNPDGRYAVVGSYSFQKGKYTFLVTYSCKEESLMKIKSGNKVLKIVKMPGMQSEISVDLDLNKPSDDLSLDFCYSGKESIQLKNIKIRSDRLFYTDSVVSGLVVILIFACLLFFRIKKEIPDPRVLISGMAVLIASLPLLSGHYVGGFDLGFHLMRIEGIRDGLLDGQFPVVIYPAAKSGHGYMGALYPSLFIYIPAILRFVHLSEPEAYNIFMILINIFTGWSMFVSVKHISDSEKTALFSAVIYLLMPFRIYNIYTGAEVGAVLGMAFYPLAVWGIYEIASGDHKKWPVLTLAFTGLIGSHVLSTLFMTIFCIVVCIFYAKEFMFETKRLTSLIKAAVCGIAMNIYFLVPFLYYQQGLRYNDVLRGKDPYQYMLTPAELFGLTPRDTLFPSAGVVTTILIMICLIFVFHGNTYDKGKTSPKSNFLSFITIAAIMSLICVTPMFPWNALKKMESIWNMIKIIQLPWRLIGVAGVLLAISASIIIMQNETTEHYRGLLVMLIVILSLVSDLALMRDYIGKAIVDDKLWGGFNDDFTDEYTPENYTSDEEMKNDVVPVFSEKIKISDYVKNGTSIYFKYSANEDSIIRLPLIWYRGYSAKTDLGTELPIRQSSIGTIEVELPEGAETGVFLRHKEVWYLRIAELISLISICLFCTGIIFSRRNSRRKKESNAE